MKAYRVRSFSTPPELVDLPAPVPAQGEVRVRIRACGLNFADLLMLKGDYQDTPPLPFVPGLEVAGIVDRCGSGVSGIVPGLRVAVHGGRDGLAEMGCFDAARCLAIPDAMPFEEAAGFQIAYGTSHLALTRRARLRAGETLLVLGAAGGVGLTAVEIGAAMGARVIAVARGEAKLDVARAAGAAHLIDAGADIRAEVKALGGADVVFDAVGGDLFRQALRATNREGRVLAIGFASGDVPQIAANYLLVKNIDVMGFYWGGYLGFAPEALTGSLAELIGMYDAGQLRPHVSHVLPLEKAGEALELLRSRTATGKVVVTP